MKRAGASRTGPFFNEQTAARSGAKLHEEEGPATPKAAQVLRTDAKGGAPNPSLSRILI